MKCVVETRDWDHVNELKETLDKQGYFSVWGSWDGTEENSTGLNATIA